MTLSRAELDAVLAPLASARPFPGRAYTDPSLFALERERIFRRAWTCVGREDDVALPGAWLREGVAGEPVLVVRGADLALRGFFDACRHRGASLVREPCGRAGRVECPYHGWTYELDGRLTGAPHAPEGLDRAAHGLVPVRVGVWRGFVFATLDEAAEPLDAWLDGAPPWLAAPTLAPLRRGHHAEARVAANWKLLVENFQESHHFPRVHEALEALTPARTARSWLREGRWLGGTMEIVDAETVSLDGERRGRPRLAFVPAPATVFDAMAFPALLTSLQPDYLLTYRLSPLSAGETRVAFDVYFHPAAFVPGFDPGDVIAFWERVNAEDQAICAQQQERASSAGFAPACYATVEEGVHAFDRLVARVYEDALAGAAAPRTGDA